MNVTVHCVTYLQVIRINYYYYYYMKITSMRQIAKSCNKTDCGESNNITTMLVGLYQNVNLISTSNNLVKNYSMDIFNI